MSDTPDSPQPTERELAQSFLIDNISQVLNITGRSKGFPRETLSTTEALGPFPIGITRVVRDGRQSWGSVIDSELDQEDVNTLINAFTPRQNLDFLDIPESVMDLLTPRIELYKVYPYEDESYGTYDVLFRPEWLKPEGRVRASEQNTQVGLTGLTVKKIGGNPAEVESNIIISVEIATMDLNNLFYRYRPTEMGTITSRANNDIPQLVAAPPEGGSGAYVPSVLRSNGIAWIDLIKMAPETVATSNAPPTREDDLGSGLLPRPRSAKWLRGTRSR